MEIKDLNLSKASLRAGIISCACGEQHAFKTNIDENNVIVIVDQTSMITFEYQKTGYVKESYYDCNGELVKTNCDRKWKDVDVKTIYQHILKYDTPGLEWVFLSKELEYCITINLTYDCDELNIHIKNFKYHVGCCFTDYADYKSDIYDSLLEMFHQVDGTYSSAKKIISTKFPNLCVKE